MKIKKKISSDKKVFLLIFIVYAVSVVLLYFLMGEQLHYRDSRGNVRMPEQSYTIMELDKSAVIEQSFSVKIQRLSEISVRWSALDRANSGTVHMSVIRNGNEELASKSFSAADISNGALTSVRFNPPLENVYNVPLTLRLTSNSEKGTSAVVMLDGEKENCSLFINGVSAAGSLCYSASGQDYIWTGKHYWKFAAAGALLILGVAAAALAKVKNGKKSFIISAFQAVKKYRFLISQIVSRDFKTKYKRSFLGILWSFLNPLLTSTVIYFVFSNLFRYDLEHYPVYLISGIIIFNFFSECCGMCLTSIVENAPLITKVYVPKYIYPLTRTLSSGINLLIALIPVFIIAVINGVYPAKGWILIIFPLLFLMIFCLGFGLILSAAMVFFRDTQFLWGVVSMIWMYLTPIFYPIDILPDNMLTLLKFNPLYYYVDFIRICVIDGVSPEPITYVKCALISVAFLILGSVVFKKAQDKFVLYL